MNFVRLALAGAVVGSGLALLAACGPAPMTSAAAAAEAEAEIQKVEHQGDFDPAQPPAKRPVEFEFGGELTQGGWVRGVAPAGTETVKLDGVAVPVAHDGSFFAAFDRDAGDSVSLIAKRKDGSTITHEIAIAPRAWNIERVNVARRSGGPSEAFMRIRRPELEQIVAARAVRSESDGWRQDFIWPVRGRISGRFGSQRIYRGEPGSYHSGIDIATGESGTPFVAPADGVVVLAAEQPFSLEGHLLMIDHGMGLNSAFLHCSEIAVSEGERVTQGQYIGRIGMSGRATGPHLHWSMKWLDARVDPILFTGPME